LNLDLLKVVWDSKSLTIFLRSLAYPFYFFFVLVYSLRLYLFKKKKNYGTVKKEKRKKTRWRLMTACTNLGSLHEHSGKGWCRHHHAWERRHTGSCQLPLAHGGFADQASARDGSRSHEGGPSGGKPDQGGHTTYSRLHLLCVHNA